MASGDQSDQGSAQISEDGFRARSWSGHWETSVEFDLLASIPFEPIEVFVQADRDEVLRVSNSLQKVRDLIDGHSHRP